MILPDYVAESAIDLPANPDFNLELLKSLPAAVYTCNNLGYIQFYNQAAVMLWGREPEVDKDLWCGSWKIFDVEGNPMPLDSCPMAIALKEKRPVIGEEIVIEKPNGERRNILPHPKPIKNSKGEVVGAVNMLVDITENKSIQALNNRLETVNQQLQHFAFAASHDLQEPLRKISAFASLVLRKHSLEIDETGKLYLNKINDSSKRMMSLISDLLTYTRESSFEEQFVPVDLNDIVNNIKGDLEFLIFEKEAEISNKPLPTLLASPSQMNRLFYNLINNSLKFSRPGVRPVIKVSAQLLENEVRVIIKDNGIGFKQEYAEKIFNLFQRLHNKDTYSGNGIGLSLCKKIMENHRGKISATSEEEKGAVFLMSFPRESLIEHHA